MNSSRVLFAFFMCFVCCNLASSKPQQQTPIQKRNEDPVSVQPNITIYQNYLKLSLAAASSGKKFFKQSNDLAQDCMKTATVIMNSLNKPSTHLKMKELEEQSILITYNQVPQMETTNLTEILCKNFNTQVKQNRSAFPDFNELKRKVNVTKLSKNNKKYILDISRKTNITEFFIRNTTLVIDKDEEMIKFDIMFRFFLHPNNMTQKDVILALSQHDAIKSLADKEFIRASDDYRKELEKTKGKKFHLFENRHEGFNKKVDQYFLKHAELGEEYRNAIAASQSTTTESPITTTERSQSIATERSQSTTTERSQSITTERSQSTIPEGSQSAAPESQNATKASQTSSATTVGFHLAATLFFIQLMMIIRTQ